MKRLLNYLPLLLLSGPAFGQLVNDGGTIVVKPGATLFVESNVTNNTVGTSTGVITVEGTLEVQGDLTNNATMNTIAGSLVKFSGTTNSNLKSNGATIQNLEMAKNNATTGTVTLTDNAKVATNLDFNVSTLGNKLVLGTNNLDLTANATTVTDANDKNYIVADAAGMVRKTVDANGSFAFPIGDADEYSPVTAAYTGSAYSTANVSANVVDATHPNKPASAESFISRYWNVNSDGITGYAATLTGTYVATDVNGTATLAKGASQADMATGTAAGDWTYASAATAASTVTGAVTTADSDFTGFNFFGKANLKVFLQGAYSASTGLMSTTLNTSTLIPIASPYSAAPFNAPAVMATSIPANVTDWILVEARDAANPATLLSQTSAFLKNDGTIIAMDGGPLAIKDANASSIIGIKHRNHLGVRTAAGVNLAANPVTSFDYSAGTGVYTNGALSNANMASVTGTNPAMVMWGGNANSNTSVNYGAFGSDRISILSSANTPGLTQGLGNIQTATVSSAYSNNDVNMNGTVNYGAFGSDRVFLLTTVLNNNQLLVLSAHQ